MKKIVKGKIEKHYCDKCGKNIFDYIPKNSNIQLFGMTIPEYSVKRYCDYKGVQRYRKGEVRQNNEYCLECWNDLSASEK